MLQEWINLNPYHLFSINFFACSFIWKKRLPRDSRKAALANRLLKVAGSLDSILVTKRFYVLDVGLLLPKKTWRKGETFEDIWQIYVDHILTNCGTNYLTMFDDYPSESNTKCTTDIQRLKVKKVPLVKMNSKLFITWNKPLFKKENNEMLPKRLKEFISFCKILALQSESDIDNLTIIQISSSNNSVVNGERTGPFILLRHHISKSVYYFFFISEKSSQEKIRIVQNVLPYHLRLYIFFDVGFHSLNIHES